MGHVRRVEGAAEEGDGRHALLPLTQRNGGTAPPPVEGAASRGEGPGELPQRDAGLDRLALAVRAAEEVEGGDPGHELVGLVAPGEAVRGLGAGHRHAGEPGAERAEGLAVGHVQLHPVAALARVLVAGRQEADRSEAHPGQPLRGEVLGQQRAVEPGGAEELEGPGGAATLGEVGALEEAHAGVDERRLRGGHVGRGQDPGKPRLARVHGPPPPPAADDLQRQAGQSRPLGAEEQRQLTDRHAVAQGEVVQAAEALEAGAERGPSTCAPPMGSGRSSTTKRSPAPAAASMQSIMVAW